jgi:hypothetical protein
MLDIHRRGRIGSRSRVDESCSMLIGKTRRGDVVSIDDHPARVVENGGDVRRFLAGFCISCMDRTDLVALVAVKVAIHTWRSWESSEKAVEVPRQNLPTAGMISRQSPARDSSEGLTTPSDSQHHQIPNPKFFLTSLTMLAPLLFGPPSFSTCSWSR